MSNIQADDYKQRMYEALERLEVAEKELEAKDKEIARLSREKEQDDKLTEQITQEREELIHENERLREALDLAIKWLRDIEKVGSATSMLATSALLQVNRILKGQEEK